eukprot:6604281-Prymnesium_polylepis.1
MLAIPAHSPAPRPTSRVARLRPPFAPAASSVVKRAVRVGRSGSARSSSSCTGDAGELYDDHMSCCAATGSHSSSCRASK